MVKILIGNVTSRIIGHLPEEVHQDLDQRLSYSPVGIEYAKSVKEGRWDGVFHLYRKTFGQFFDTGLISFVTKTLDDHAIEYHKVDDRKRPEVNLPDLKFSPFQNYEERDYQQFTIDRAYKRSRGILKVATGGGKTLIISELIGKIKTAPFMFYVLTKDLMEQAYEALSTTLNEPIGRIGGGNWDIQKINVCTVQTAVRAVNLKNKKFKISDYQFDEEDIWDKKQIESEDKLENLKNLLRATRGLYFDEAHHAAAKTVQDTVNASPNAFWRYGGSATPFREDGAEIMLQALFGKKIVDISASYLIENGFLIEPYVFFEPIEHNCDLHSYRSIYSECIVNNDEFNLHVADTANFLVEHGLSTLVLVQQINHGKFLQNKIPGSILVTGNVSNKLRKQSIQDLRDKKCLCMVATCLADEGLDIPTLDAALLAGGGASSTRVHQRIGRTLRKDRASSSPRDRSIVVCYKHDVKYLKDHANKCLRIIKEEPKFNVIKSKGTNHILGEISNVMGLNYHSKTIFDL
ncbi:MAG: DEAD/DEAH box helicase family protein [Synergistaceae bacterium]